jgi:hypothetical protein
MRRYGYRKGLFRSGRGIGSSAYTGARLSAPLPDRGDVGAAVAGSEPCTRRVSGRSSLPTSFQFNDLQPCQIAVIAGIAVIGRAKNHSFAAVGTWPLALGKANPNDLQPRQIAVIARNRRNRRNRKSQKPPESPESETPKLVTTEATEGTEAEAETHFATDEHR